MAGITRGEIYGAQNIICWHQKEKHRAEEYCHEAEKHLANTLEHGSVAYDLKLSDAEGTAQRLLPLRLIRLFAR